MKRFLMFALLVLAVAVPAFASEVGDGDARRNPTSTAVGGVAPDGLHQLPLHMSTTGDTLLKVTEGAQNRDLSLDVAAFATDTLSLGTGRVDSTTTPIYTAAYGRLFLSLKLAPGAGYAATTWVKLAIQVRAGNSIVSDTTAFQAFLPTYATKIDSVGLQYGSVPTAASNIVAKVDEFVVYVPFTDGNSTGAYFEIVDRDGRSYWGKYTTVRVKVIGASVAGLGTNAGGVPWYRISGQLLGRPF